MEINDIKDGIREQLESCEDRELLLDVLVKLIPFSSSSYKNEYVKEPEVKYQSISGSPVPKEHYDLLVEDRKKLLKGEIKGKPWGEVYKRLKARK